MPKTRILHIGDLHYDSQKGDPSFRYLEDRMIPLLTKDQSTYGKYNLVVMSGDVPSLKPDGDKGEKDLKDGFKFLCTLRKELGYPPLLICIGNHDAKRPTPDRNFVAGQRVSVFNDFISGFNEIRKGSENDLVRPLSPEDSPSKEDVEAALEVLIAANFDRSKLLDSGKIDLLPFFWLREEKVFCYLLSTVDFCATLHTEKGTDPIKMHDAIATISDPKIHKKLMESTFRRDVPYVREAQLNVLEWIVNYLDKHPALSDVFRASIKIAAFHHPLILLPEETDIEDIDRPGSVINGPGVAGRLTSLGFLIFLYGHKHYGRTSINFGNWTRESPVNIDEFVGLCGDSIFPKEGPFNPTFLVLEIEDISGERFSERAISEKRINATNTLSEQKKLMSFELNGNLKWIHCDNESLVVRQHTINEKICDLVKQVENCFLSTTEYDWTTDYKNAEAFLFEFMNFLEDYCKGQYGLDKEFISHLEEDLKAVDALYFIDILESPAWAHPNFMHHLALQIRDYSNRNHNQLQSKNWSHSEPVERALIRLKYHTGREKPNKESDKTTLPDSPTLFLDICRILIWDEEKLKTISGRILIRLHEVFQIPLLYLGKQFSMQHFKKHQLKEGRDFHLILEGEEVRGEFYDETKKNRIGLPDARAYLELYKGLLEDDNLDIAARKAGLEKWK